MGLWTALRKRRVFQFLGAYIAGGFLALEGVDQLVGNGILPELAYPLALIFYLAGIPGTTIIAWFHGEKGTQKPPAIEIWLQATLLAATLAVCAVVVRNYQAQAAAEAAAVELGLDSRRVAVLYFEDLSREGELAYLADGLTEALIEQLSQVRALDVVSRNGVAPFRDTELRPDSIARILEAGSLIEGGVEPVGRERLRVTARLVDGVSGADIERRAFESRVGDLLSLQDSLAQDVSRFLRERLGDEVRLRERRAETSSTDAWTLVQRAERLRKDAEALLHEEDYERAFAAFERADSVLAIAETADANWVEPVILRGWIAYRRARLAEDAASFEAWTEVGLGHADRALAMSPGNAEALELRGTLRYASWVFLRPPDPDEADALLNRARADLEAATRADPTLASAHSTLSHLYYQVDDVAEAVLAARRAYEEDAYLELADQVLWRLFNGSLDLEQFAQAQRWCREGARRFPNDYRFGALCRLRLMITPATSPDVERAWQLAARLDSLAPEPARGYWRLEGELMVGGVLARAGLPDSARAVLAEVRRRMSHEVDPEQELLPVEAYVLTLLGDRDRAVDLLKRYAAAHPGHFDEAVSASWWWRGLQGHPEFQELFGTGGQDASNP